MFRSIAVYLDQSLQKCKRSDLGWPQLPQLATKETRKADKLRREIISKMIKIEKSYQQRNEEQGFDKHFDVDFGTFQEQIKWRINLYMLANQSVWPWLM